MSFSLIDGTNLSQLIDLYDLNSEIILKIYNATSYDQYTCLMQPLERERILLLDTGIWGNVKVELDEV
jgi:hypothetical protein